MSVSRTLRTRLAALGLAAALVVPAVAVRADDSTLFTTTYVSPNVLFLIDNSGSMNELSWHPAYDPTQTYSCKLGTTYGTWNGTTNTTGAFDPTQTYSIDSSGNFHILGSGTSYGTATQTHCGNTHTIPVDPTAYNGSTRYDGGYLNWLFSNESNAYWSDILSTTNGVPSACVGGSSYAKYQRVKMTAARQVMKEVLCALNLSGGVRVGLANFRNDSDPPGGYVIQPIGDMNATQYSNLVSAINSMQANTWTPLGESLFQLYTYFMSRTSSKLPKGKDGVTLFPLYQFSTGSDGAKTSSPPADPVQYKCQKNFIVVVTDGEPTKDTFATGTGPTGTDAGFSNFKSKLIGDYNPDGQVEEPGGTDLPAYYLDDIALFMEKNDFRPDFPNTQKVDTYTIGFTTGPVANALLQKTATNGNGLFLTSNNADQLAQALIDSLSDIISKAQSFTAATVPASRTKQGDKIYVSLFVPASGTAWWEGHLRSYELTGSGQIDDKNGNCAIDDPSGQCQSGPFLDVGVAPPFWDSFYGIPSATSRNLTVSVLRGTTPAPTVAQFVHQTGTPTTGISNTDLALVYPPAVKPAGSVATTADGYADELVANVRGCKFGTGVGSVACVKREGQMADVFHSNPVVVGEPEQFEADPSFQTGFKNRVAGRKRVIYAGANGGFLNGFDAGTWQASATPPDYSAGTGAELFGFMPWPARSKIQYKPTDTGTRKYYFVDGSPTVADAWLYSDYTVGTKATDGSEWRTVLVGSMRQGGNAYFALDVTDPSATTCTAPAKGSGYPCYLWEFPRENDSTAYKNWVGQTWGDPIITKVRVQVGASVLERWVAVVSGGYDPTGDPNTVTYSATATAGRSIWVVDLETGKPLAWRKFDTAGDCTNPAAAANNTAERKMCFSLAATPAVYDTDGDGFADLIYVGDLGGNLWKWVIKAPLTLSGATTASQPATDWPFRQWFSAPVYTSGTSKYYKSFYFSPAATKKNNTIWLAFGSGERNNLLFTGDATTTADNNRFYVVTETDLYEQNVTPNPVLGESNLTNLTSTSTCGSLGSTRGYYMVGREGEKWVTSVDIFTSYVLANSYLVTTASGDPCDIAGEAFLWAFRVDCGLGLFSDASGNPTRTQDIGAGLPTDPRVTVGSNGDTTNRVIISRQGGDINNLTAPPGFPTSGSFYWRELSQ